MSESAQPEELVAIMKPIIIKNLDIMLANTMSEAVDAEGKRIMLPSLVWTCELMREILNEAIKGFKEPLFY